MAKNDEDISLTAKTPWGALITSKGIQVLLERFADDISLIKKRIKKIESSKFETSPEKGIKTENNSIGQVKEQVKELDERIDHLDQRLTELDSRFTRFSSQAIQLLNQLSDKINK
ncbi:MAG: hypothetical protein ACXAC7_03365 [Candidatus Hodarchaeales archaeon]|jgi:prefoldin subunit 5